jgi:hypothetical protein
MPAHFGQHEGQQGATLSVQSVAQRRERLSPNSCANLSRFVPPCAAGLPTEPG